MLGIMSVIVVRTWETLYEKFDKCGETYVKNRRGS